MCNLYSICQFAMLFNCFGRRSTVVFIRYRDFDDIARFFSLNKHVFIECEKRQMRWKVPTETKYAFYISILRFVWCIAVLMPIKINFLQFAIVHLRRWIFSLYIAFTRRRQSEPLESYQHIYSFNGQQFSSDRDDQIRNDGESECDGK